MIVTKPRPDLVTAAEERRRRERKSLRQRRVADLLDVALLARSCQPSTISSGQLAAT